MTRHPFHASRYRAVCGAALATLVLAGCDTVPLDTPAPVVPLNPPPVAAPVPPAPRIMHSEPPAPEAPQAEAQPLAPAPAIHVQPLEPAPLASAPQAAPAASQPQEAASAPFSPGFVPPAPAASAPAAAASAPAPAPATPADAVRYVCTDRTAFLAVFGDVNVMLSTTLGVIRLEQTLSADGARYSNGDLQVWFKGREATVTNLTHPGSKTLCIEQR